MESKEILESFMPSQFPLDKFYFVKIERNKNDKGGEVAQLMYPESLSYYFDEVVNIPGGYEKSELLSKGFTEYKRTFDLPLRNKIFKIKTRMRKWLVKATGKVISNELKIIEKGTKNTKELAFF
ncbi:MAG: hypothetical protein Q9M94_04910 [Candidatus Gracilibacteria bacterium]|nr:hypothetical protein [Candidatus Gracilibacteria bacterium]MDQ7022012.1 hypothetical protein [Candidatus Gracilibacteria bacterium]